MYESSLYHSVRMVISDCFLVGPGVTLTISNNSLHGLSAGEVTQMLRTVMGQQKEETRARDPLTHGYDAYVDPDPVPVLTTGAWCA